MIPSPRALPAHRDARPAGRGASRRPRHAAATPPRTVPAPRLAHHYVPSIVHQSYCRAITIRLDSPGVLFVPGYFLLSLPSRVGAPTCFAAPADFRRRRDRLACSLNPSPGQ
eukprot:gene12870-biopygen21516